MSLLDAFMEPCCLMQETRVKDGAGGFISEWTEGETFNAAITHDTSMNAVIAEKQGVTSVYKVTTYGSLLRYDDKIKRLSDGRYFRITSDSADVHSPYVASFDISQATAERWELTT